MAAKGDHQRGADHQEMGLCGVCWQQYRDPRLLPCLHAVCKECIDEISVTDRSGTIKCPFCRTACRLPDKGATGLPKEFMAAAAVDCDEDTSSPRCFMCDDAEADLSSCATVWCEKCEGALCDAHIAHHITASPADETHPISSLRTASKNVKRRIMVEQKALLCADHDRPLRLHCGSCDVSICGDCAVFGNHKGHRPIRLVSDVLEPRKSRVAGQVDKLQRRTMPRLQRSLQAFDSACGELERWAEEMDARIRQAGKRAAEAVERCVAEMLEQVGDITQARLKILGQQRDELKANLEAAENAIRFSQKMSQLTQSSGAFFSLLRALETRVAGLNLPEIPNQPHHHPRLLFQPARNDFVETETKKIVGELSSCQASARHSVIEGELTKSAFQRNSVEIIARLKDEAGDALATGGDVVTTRISGPSQPPVKVRDNCNGSYTISCGGAPAGTYQLEVLINGETVPSIVTLTYLRHEKRWDPTESHSKIRISQNGQKASLDERVLKHCSVLGTTPMSSGVHTWKVKIGSEPGFQMLGIATKPLSAKRYDDYKTSAYCWQSNGYCSCRDGVEWENVRLCWSSNDTFELTLNCDRCTLRITNLSTRKERKFTGILRAEYYPFASLHSAGNSVEFVQ